MWSADCSVDAEGNAAVPAVDKCERTQRGTVLGAIGGHGSLQKERLDFGIFGEFRGSETHFRTERVYQSDNYGVNEIFGRPAPPRVNC
jgi:hypothetical protein